MELRELKLFIYVAERKSFTRAAMDLFVSHSTTSRAVSSLEDELGVQLFVRSGNTLSLTPAGESLLRDARELLSNAEQIKENIKPFR